MARRKNHAPLANVKRLLDASDKPYLSDGTREALTLRDGIVFCNVNFECGRPPEDFVFPNSTCDGTPAPSGIGSGRRFEVEVSLSLDSPGRTGSRHQKWGPQ